MRTGDVVYYYTSGEDQAIKVNPGGKLSKGTEESLRKLKHEIPSLRAAQCDMHNARLTMVDSSHHSEDWTFMEGDHPVHVHFDLQRTKMMRA